MFDVVVEGPVRWIRSDEWHSIQQPHRFECPCCHHPTLAGRRVYDICVMCGWEDDPYAPEEPDVVLGGPNGDYSLSEARRNFGLYLSQYRPADPLFTIHKCADDQVLDLKRDLVDLCDQIRLHPTSPSVPVLWPEVLIRLQELHKLIYGR